MEDLSDKLMTWFLTIVFGAFACCILIGVICIGVTAYKNGFTLTDMTPKCSCQIRVEK
jgi:hypothetical protein